MSLTEKIIVLALGLLIIILWATTHFNKTDTLKQLKEKYEEALAGVNKAEAFEAGNAYYRYLRGGELSAADEQAIMNDVGRMREEETGKRDSG